MNELETKVDALAARLEGIRRKAVTGTITTAIVYGLLVVFVFGYTNFVIVKLKKLATPDNLSALARASFQGQLPALRRSIVTIVKDYAPQLADYVADLPREVLPAIEQQIKDLADSQVDALAVAVKTDLVPRMMEVLDTNAAAINLTAESLKDQSVANGLALLLVDEVELQMEKMFNEQFHRSCLDLRDQIDQLRERPVDKLTNKELAERKLLAGWVFLVEYGDAESTYGNVLERLGHMYEFMFHSFKQKVEGEPAEL